MKTVAILYATREGQTRKVAERVAADLRGRGFAVCVKNVRDEPPVDLGMYSAAILAASVHVGKHEREMVKFAREHCAQLEAMPAVFLSVNLSEAAVERPGESAEKRAQCATAVREAISRFVRETGWHPRHVKAVAGALAFTRYNLLIRFVMKRIAQAGGNETDTSRDYEYTDWVALDHYVDELAAEFSSIST